MLGGESVKEKETAAPFVVTFIFIGYASRNKRWDKTETHKVSQRSHKGLQGLTCIEMLIKCRLVILI